MARRTEDTAKPPYDTSSESLFVAYYASAEIGCHLALGWETPANILDLYVEFRNFTNGLPTPCGAGLIGALTYFGLGGIEALEKASMRELAMRGGPFTTDEGAALVDYCETDVEALARLFPKMLPHMDVPLALIRGRYKAAAAHIRRNGVPIDTTTLTQLRENWGGIQDGLIAAIDQDYGVYDGRSFKRERFERYFTLNKIPWPRLPSGQLDMKDDTFREMGLSVPDAPSRASHLTVTDASQRSRRRPGWPQSDPALGLPLAHWAQPAFKFRFRLRPCCLAARSH